MFEPLQGGDIWASPHHTAAAPTFPSLNLDPSVQIAPSFSHSSSLPAGLHYNPGRSYTYSESPFPPLHHLLQIPSTTCSLPVPPTSHINSTVIMSFPSRNETSHQAVFVFCYSLYNSRQQNLVLVSFKFRKVRFLCQYNPHIRKKRSKHCQWLQPLSVDIRLLNYTQRTALFNPTGLC